MLRCFIVKLSITVSDYNAMHRMFVQGNYLPVNRLYLLFVPTRAGLVSSLQAKRALDSLNRF